MSNPLISSCVVEAVERIQPTMSLYAKATKQESAAQQLSVLAGVMMSPDPSRVQIISSIKADALLKLQASCDEAKLMLKGAIPHEHGEDGSCDHRHIHEAMRDYQLYLYEFAFAALLEAALGGIDADEALDDVEDMSVEYRMIHTNCVNSVQAHAIDTSESENPLLAGAKVAGQAVKQLVIMDEDVAAPFIFALEG